MPEFPIFDPLASFEWPQWPQKWLDQIFIYSLGKCDISGDSIISVTSVEISFFLPIIVELSRDDVVLYGEYMQYLRKIWLTLRN